MRSGSRGKGGEVGEEAFGGGHKRGRREGKVRSRDNISAVSCRPSLAGFVYYLSWLPTEGDTVARYSPLWQVGVEGH